MKINYIRWSRQNKKIFRIVLMNLIDKYEIKSVKEITDVYRNSKINSLVRYYAETKSKFIKKLILKFNNIFWDYDNFSIK